MAPGGLGVIYACVTFEMPIGPWSILDEGIPNYGWPLDVWYTDSTDCSTTTTPQGGGGLPPCAQLLAQAMENFLKAHNSPLVSQDPNFVAEVLATAGQDNVDPRLLMAETAESSYGASTAATQMDNPFGLLAYRRTKAGATICRPMNFAQGARSAAAGVDDAIDAEGLTLEKYSSVAQMYSSGPGAYCQSPGCVSFGPT